MTTNQFDGIEIPPFVQTIFKNVKKILVGILLLIVVWSGFFQVGAEEVGVITRFGKYTRMVESGLNFKIPLIEIVQKVPVERQQKQEFGFRTLSSDVRSEYTKQGTSEESLMLTGDLNLADVEWVVQYRISDATIIYSWLGIRKVPCAMCQNQPCVRWWVIAQSMKC